MSQYFVKQSDSGLMMFNFGKCNWEQYQAKMKEVNEYKEKVWREAEEKVYQQFCEEDRQEELKKNKLKIVKKKKKLKIVN